MAQSDSPTEKGVESMAPISRRKHHRTGLFALTRFGSAELMTVGEKR